MRTLPLIRVAAAVLVTGVTLACSDVPLLPQWTVDMYVPIGGSRLGGLVVGTPIPPGAAINTPGNTRNIPMDGVAGQALDQALGLAAPTIKLEVVITKSASLQVALSDTLFLAGDAVGLAASGIFSGIAMPAAATSVTDTVAMGPAALNLFRQLVDAQGTLWMQARGRASYAGAAPYVVQPTDSIFIKVSLLIKVPIAGGK